MRVTRIDSTELAPWRRHAETGQVAASEARALVAIEPPVPHSATRWPMRHPAAPFIAQLIAARLRAPQTRDRRRAEPEEAIAAYREMMGRRRV
jgi:hypothetical protein